MATYTHDKGKKEALRNSAFLVVKGEAGFGKTALMSRAISTLRRKYSDLVILQACFVQFNFLALTL
jgi:Ni2+-binding GTPase involved in maturation of urease and hydrogenase